MPRRRLTLRYLQNLASRKNTYVKRKRGLLKKVHELSTLCGVEVCAVVMSDLDATATVYPSLPGLQHAVARFDNMPEYEKSKNEANLIEFNRKRLYKLQMKLFKQLCENKDLEMHQKINECLSGESSVRGNPLHELDAIDWTLQRKRKDLDELIKSVKLENAGMQVGGSSNNGMSLQTGN